MTVRVSTLTNGLHIATDRIDTVDTVSLGIWVDVGTRHEPPAINGVAHFLEHMAFKGTERRSALAIAEEIEAVGGHLNAYTSRESTAFYAKVLKEDVPLALDILADILQHSTFEAEEMERERTVILQEIGQANDTPDDIIFDHFQECAFPDQAMGRPVLGRPEIIRRLGARGRHRLSARPLRRPADGVGGGRQPRPRPVRGAGGEAAGRDAGRSPGHHRAGALCRRRPARAARSGTAAPGAGVSRADPRRPRLLRRLGIVDRVRRRHVVTAVSGDPRKAGAGLYDPLLCPQLS